MSRPALLLIPGFSLTQRIWEKQIPEFEKHFQLITPDLPGHGKTPPLDHKHSLQEIGTLLSQNLTQQEIKQCSVLGWSMGGMIAQHMALDFPEQVEKLILVGSSPQFVASTDFPYAVRPGGHAKLKKQLKDNIQEGLAEFLRFATKDHVLKDHPDFLNFIRSSTKVDPNSILFYMDALLEFSTLADLEKINCPTLVIAGETDPLCPPQASEYLAHQIPHAQLQSFSDTGHFPFLTHAEEFNQSVIEFLTGES